MTNDNQSTPSARYHAAVLTAAGRDLGRPIPKGTSVVSSQEREGSTAAVTYALGDRTIIWCAPELQPHLSELEAPAAMTLDDFASAASHLGGVFAGAGHNRVLTRPPSPTPALISLEFSELDRDSIDDKGRIEQFIAASSEEDLDEAELYLDELDEHILAACDPDGAIASYVSARPWSFDPAFDDIAVITHPDHRGKRLGATLVAEFSRRRHANGRLLFYNCNVENLGSNKVAEAVGFELMNTVVAADFA